MTSAAQIPCWWCGAVWFSDAGLPHVAREGRACLACGEPLAAARLPTYVWERLPGDDADFVLRRANEPALEISAGRAASLVGLTASELYADDSRPLEILREASTARGPLRRRLPGYRVPSTGDVVDAEVEARPGLDGLVLLTVRASAPTSGRSA